MKELSLKEFYAQSLELKAPWKVVEVVIDGEARQVRIRVECARGEVWGDPDRLVVGGAEPVDLSREIHGLEHLQEFGIEAVLGSFGQLSGLDPEIGLEGIGIFAAEFAHLSATLPGPAADIQENILLAMYFSDGRVRGFFNRLLVQ